MRRLITAIMAAAIFLALPSTARADNTPNSTTFYLLFEGIGVGNQVDDYYGSQGIHFTNGFVATSDWGPDCFYMGGGPCAAELTSSGVIMDVDPGFLGHVAFYYTDSDGFTKLSIYSGLDGSGELLASGLVPKGSGIGGDWPIWELDFSGTAYSVVFTGDTGIEFSSLAGGQNIGPIPEPTSLILLATGVAGLGGMRRLRHSTRK